MVLPAILGFEAKPQRIMRSLLGHISAQGVGRYRKGAITEPLKNYILDLAVPLPNEIRIYC